MAEIKSPIVYIFDSSGSSLIRNTRGIAVGMLVSDFTYVFDEEEDDECNIVFQTDDRYLPDSISLQEDCVIVVRWGYIGLPLSQPRKLCIRDTKTRYKDTGIEFELECTDMVSYLKNEKDKETKAEQFLDYLKNKTKDRFNLHIEVRNETVGFREPAFVETGENGDAFIKSAIDNTSFLQHIRKELIVDQAGKTTWNIIGEELEKAPDGPYMMDGRDDTLTIKNRDFNQAPIRHYKYNFDDPRLLEFIVETDHQNSDKEIAEATYIDPDTGEQAAVKVIKEGERKEVFSQKLQQIAEGYHEENYKNLEDLYLKGVVEDFENNMNGPDTPVDMSYSVSHRVDRSTPAFVEVGQPFISAAVDATNVVETFRIPGLLMETWFADMEFIKEAILNEIKDKEHKRVIANVTVEGDPLIPVSKTVMMYSVANKHKGVWYIAKTRHRISKGNGYVTEMLWYKKPTFSKAKVAEFERDWQTISENLNGGTPLNNRILESDVQFFGSTKEEYEEMGYEVIPNPTEPAFIYQGEPVFYRPDLTRENPYDPSSKSLVGEEDIPINAQLDSDVNNYINNKTFRSTTDNQLYVVPTIIR